MRCSSSGSSRGRRRRVRNYLKTLNMELTTIARACGKQNVHHLEREDLVALTVEAAAMASVPLAGTNWIPGVAGTRHFGDGKARSRSNTPAEQRPGAVAANGKSLDRFIGNVIRELRLKDNLTIAEVAAQAGISRGMVSKIENGQVSTSLETLSKIAQALGVSLAHLFRHYNMPSGGAQLVKNGAGMEVVRRGTRRGHTYHLLAYDQGPGKTTYTRAEFP